jgi:hypothetical protein
MVNPGTVGVYDFVDATQTYVDDAYNIFTEIQNIIIP